MEIVRPMVEAGAALAVMGNHELNALAFHTPDRNRPGEHLRRHDETNSNQHAETMRRCRTRRLKNQCSRATTVSSATPELLRANVACLDWSVARGDFLCAYRWDGEGVLDPGNFRRCPDR